jgi:hypothetical protein
MKVLSIAFLFQMPLREEYMKRTVLIGHPSIIGVLIALAPKFQGPDIATVMGGDIGPFPLQYRPDFERPTFAMQKKGIPRKGKVRDHHAFQKHQIPRNRVGRKR